MKVGQHLRWLGVEPSKLECGLRTRGRRLQPGTTTCMSNVTVNTGWVRCARTLVLIPHNRTGQSSCLGSLPSEHVIQTRQQRQECFDTGP